jgi:tetratricopeptide (TPR) repeat protein
LVRHKVGFHKPAEATSEAADGKSCCYQNIACSEASGMKVLPSTTTVLTPTRVAELLADGLRLHQAGQLVEAEAHYKRVLAAQPDHGEALNLLGLVSFQQGRYDLAVELIGRAIERNGHNAGYLSNLGNVLYASGKFDEAVTAYRQAINKRLDFAESHPNLGEAYNNLGGALNELGRHDEALDAYHNAIRNNPRDAKAFYNLGVTLAKLGMLEPAIDAHRQAVSIKPDFAEAYFHVGAALKVQGKLEAAVAAYHQAIHINPEFVEAYNNLGGALNELGRRDEAIAAYRQAITIRPHDGATFYNFGVALAEQGKLDEAISAYRRAVTIKPDFTEARCNLGLVLKEQGEIDEARSLLEATLSLAPTRAIAYRILGYVKKFSANDRHIVAMERLARDMQNLSSDEQINLHFALAKAYEDLDERDRVLRHLLDGNALKRKEITYDEAATVALFDRIRAVFTPALIDSKCGYGDASAVPVFIIGMPRSGKTTVERILANHPHFHGAGELDEFRSVAIRLSRPNNAPASFPELVPTLSEQRLKQLGTAYLGAIRAAVPGAERISNTTPGNVRFIGLIHLALPNARIIHVRRDPVEVCVSCFAMLFNRNAHAYSYDLGELGRYYRAHEALMTHWRRVLPKSIMLEVKLDQLVADAEHKTRELVAHCGLEWDDACLAAARAIEVRRPIYRRWIEGSPADANALRPLVEELGGDVAGSTGSTFSEGSVTSAATFPNQDPDNETATVEKADTPDAPILPRLVGQRHGPQMRAATSKREILIDAVKAVAIHNGLLRVYCTAGVPNKGERSSGILLISGNQAGPIVRALTQAVQELEGRLREQVQ